MLRNRTLSFSIRGFPSRAIDLPNSFVEYKIYSTEDRVTAIRPKCLYFSEALGEWTGASGSAPLCSLVRETTEFIECRCKHMSTYGVRAVVDDSGIADYGISFYVCVGVTMVNTVES